MAVTITDLDPDLEVKITLVGAKTELQPQFASTKSASGLVDAQAWLAGQLLQKLQQECDDALKGNSMSDAELDAEKAVIAAVMTNRVSMPDISV